MRAQQAHLLHRSEFSAEAGREHKAVFGVRWERSQQAHVYAKDLSEVWAPMLGVWGVWAQQADMPLDVTGEA